MPCPAGLFWDQAILVCTYSCGQDAETEATTTTEGGGSSATSSTDLAVFETSGGSAETASFPTMGLRSTAGDVETSQSSSGFETAADAMALESSTAVLQQNETGNLIYVFSNNNTSNNNNNNNNNNNDNDNDNNNYHYYDYPFHFGQRHFFQRLVVKSESDVDF